MEQFKRGDEVFMANGQHAVYEAFIDGAHYVFPLYDVEDECGEWHTINGPLARAKAVYLTEPQPKLGDRINSEQARLDRLCDQVNEKHHELGQIKSEITRHAIAKQDIEKAAQKHAEVAQVIDFLEGRITHIVEHPTWGEPKVHVASDFLSQMEDGRSDGLFLISLFGTCRKGRPHPRRGKWCRNHYKDGSGSTVEFTPFRSLQEAEDFIKRMFDEALLAWRTEGRPEPSRVAKIADAIGAELPEDLAAAIDDKKRAALLNKVELSAQKLREAEEALAAFGGAAVAAA